MSEDSFRDPAPEVHTIRVASVALTGAILYFFLSRGSAQKWDPWWMSVFRSLCELRPQASDWQLEPSQNVRTSSFTLSPQLRSELQTLLSTAPQKELDEHRSLAKTLNNLATGTHPVQIMFFQAPSPEDQSS